MKLLILEGRDGWRWDLELKRRMSEADIILHAKLPFSSVPAKPFGHHPPWTHYVTEDRTHGEFFAEMMDQGFDLHYYCNIPDYFGVFPGSGTVFLDDHALMYLKLLVG